MHFTRNFNIRLPITCLFRTWNIIFFGRVAGAAHFWNFRLRLQLQTNPGSYSYSYSSSSSSSYYYSSSSSYCSLSSSSDTVQKKIKIYTGIDAIKGKITLGSRKNNIFRVGVGAGAGPKKRLRLHPKTAAPATLVFGTNFISTWYIWKILILYSTFSMMVCWASQYCTVPGLNPAFPTVKPEGGGRVHWAVL